METGRYHSRFFHVFFAVKRYCFLALFLPANCFLRASVYRLLDFVLGTRRLACHTSLFRFLIQLEAILGYGCASTAAGAFFFVDNHCLCHCLSFPSLLKNVRGVKFRVLIHKPLHLPVFSVNPYCSVSTNCGYAGVGVVLGSEAKQSPKPTNGDCQWDRHLAGHFPVDRRGRLSHHFIPRNDNANHVFARSATTKQSPWFGFGRFSSFPAPAWERGDLISRGRENFGYAPAYVCYIFCSATARVDLKRGGLCL